MGLHRAGTHQVAVVQASDVGSGNDTPLFMSSVSTGSVFFVGD